MMNQEEESKGYVEIQIPGPAGAKEEVVEVTLEDETPEPEFEKVEKVAKQEPNKPQFGAEKGRKERARQRIQQLSSEKRDVMLQLEQERAARMELEKRLNEGSKANNEALKARLEDAIKLLSSQLVEAMKNGDSDLVVETQDLLIEAKMELAGIRSAIATHKPVVQEQVERSQPKQAVLPPKAMEWIDTYPMFKTDRLFNAAAITVNNVLLEEGWDPNSDDFYDEITSRLAPRFPEVFGTKNKNVVSSEEDGVEYASDDSSEDGGDGEYSEEEDVKSSSKVNKPQSKQVKEQTVSSPSRAPAATVKKAQSLQKVKLTQQDVAQAKRFGMSLEQYAKRMQHAEKHKTEDGGYVPIFMEGL